MRSLVGQVQLAGSPGIDMHQFGAPQRALFCAALAVAINAQATSDNRRQQQALCQSSWIRVRVEPAYYKGLNDKDRDQSRWVKIGLLLNFRCRVIFVLLET